MFLCFFLLSVASCLLFCFLVELSSSKDDDDGDGDDDVGDG